MRRISRRWKPQLDELSQLSAGDYTYNVVTKLITLFSKSYYSFSSIEAFFLNTRR